MAKKHPTFVIDHERVEQIANSISKDKPFEFDATEDAAALAIAALGNFWHEISAVHPGIMAGELNGFSPEQSHLVNMVFQMLGCHAMLFEAARATMKTVKKEDRKKLLKSPARFKQFQNQVVSQFVPGLFEHNVVEVTVAGRKMKATPYMPN